MLENPATDLVEIHKLSCGYHGSIVVHEISATLSAGSVTALLGPNGSGKSTLLKTLIRLLRPLSGEVTVFGKRLGEVSFRSLAKLVAYVPQQETTAFPFSVRQVVTMGRLPYSDGLFNSEEDRHFAEEAMRVADCANLATRPVTELSGGEHQRVLLARALAQQAPALLLDEPTSHLDVGHQIAVAKVLRTLAQEGKTVLVALHDLNLANQMADRAILLDGGRAAKQGTVHEVLSDEALDRVYGVQFQRVQTDDGHLRVFPQMPVA